jgi:uncharacterized protein (TIGR03435 family)
MRLASVCLGLLVATAGMAQTAPAGGETLEFEVASIKPFVPPAPQGGRMMAFGGVRGGPGTDDPGHVTANGVTLKNLLMRAYNVKSYQITGPAWIDSERYAISAKVPAEATKEQVLVMWQTLLAQRFQLKFHRETKELPVFEVVVAKGGPKLKESTPEPEVPKEQPAKPPDAPNIARRMSLGADGCPAAQGGRGGTMMMMMPGRFRMCATNCTMEMLVNFLTGQVSRPIFDKTGLTGKYDFRLEFAPDGNNNMGMLMPPPGGGAMAGAASGGPPPDGGGGIGPMGPPQNQEPAPPIATAFQNQLGLKLEPKKAPVEILIIDAGEKTPVEN